MYQSIDLILRIILMSFFTIFFLLSLFNYRKVKAQDLKVSARYFLACAFLFLMSLLNYIQAEINVHTQFYPDLEWTVYFGLFPLYLPFNTVIFFIIFIPSILPLVYVIEIHFQKWERPYLTVVAVVSFFLFILALVVPAMTVINLFIAIVVLGLVLTLFTSLYVKMAIRAKGKLRASAILIVSGLIIQLVSLLLPMPKVITYEPIISHTIAIIGNICLFIGMILTSE